MPNTAGTIGIFPTNSTATEFNLLSNGEFIGNYHNVAIEFSNVTDLSFA